MYSVLLKSLECSRVAVAKGKSLVLYYPMITLTTFTFTTVIFIENAS